MLAALLPTPSCFHYLFNPRDLSRVMEGLLLSTAPHFSTPEAFARLWRNECLRIFHDRLISAEHKQVSTLWDETCQWLCIILRFLVLRGSLPRQVVEQKICALLHAHSSSDIAESAAQDPILFGALDDIEVQYIPCVSCTAFLQQHTCSSTPATWFVKGFSVFFRR